MRHIRSATARNSTLDISCGAAEVVALLIFALGGGVSILEGIRHIQHPPALSHLGWNHFILAALSHSQELLCW